MSYLEKEKDLHKMIGEGNLLGAFDKYYADNVVMEEPRIGRMEGKEANRKREEEFIGSIKEWHDGGVRSIASNEEEGITMSEQFMDVTFADGNRMAWEETSVKKWEGDQIVHEKFYYNMPNG